jgi:hypothetical protein
MTPHRPERRITQPARAPEQSIPVDELPISVRQYDDDSVWFGKITKPSGQITPNHEHPAH